MKYLSLVLIVISTFACKSKQAITTADPSQLTQVLELNKTPCFGECPTFTLKIYDNGLAVLDGVQNVKQIGLSHMMLSDSQMSLLTKKCDEANLFSLKGDYNERVMDLPTTTLTYIENGRTKKISGNMNLPDGFKDVVKTCMKIVDMDGWELKEAYNTK